MGRVGVGAHLRIVVADDPPGEPGFVDVVRNKNARRRRCFLPFTSRQFEDGAKKGSRASHEQGLFGPSLGVSLGRVYLNSIALLHVHASGER